MLVHQRLRLLLCAVGACALAPSRRDFARSLVGVGGVAVAESARAAPADTATLKAALLAAIPAMRDGAPATNATISGASAAAIEVAAADLERASNARGSARNPALDGNWRLVYSNAPEITSLARLPAGFRLGPVYQPFDLRRAAFENQGAVLHATGLIRGSTRVVGDFRPAARGSLNAAGVVNDRDRRVDVEFRRVVFALDRPLAARTVVRPTPDPALARPAVDATFLDDALRVTRGGDGALFVLVRAPAAVPMLSDAERASLYGGGSSDVVSGAGLGNWSRTAPGVVAGSDAGSRYGARAP